MARRTGGDGVEPQPAEGYSASVSDLMAALIFVFILTVAVFALRLAQAKEEVESLLENSAEARTKLLQHIKSRLSKKGIEVSVELDHGVLRIREKGISFESGAAAPVGQYAHNVGMIAQVLADVLPYYVADEQKSEQAQPSSARPAYCASARPAYYDPSPTSSCEDHASARVETVLIEGHTDPHPIKGENRDNLDLSSARAAHVFRIMTECEPRLETLLNSSKLKVLGVSGYADRRPVSKIDEQNRRIDLRFMMELPKLESGRAASAVTEHVAEKVGR